ncbi:DUF7384 family protein [Salinigranum rubrum]|uniref:DUF7384 family protein n=1 Tax=Salinigranum rubrum TaxID=755307 RepID=UPI00156D9291|nr:hypothetical protein [Salinigranum rubrum]
MTRTWEELFERAAAYDVSEADVRTTLETVRSDEDEGDGDGRSDEPTAPSPARVVADADVLAADLLVGGDSRSALDHVRRHSWMTLVASDALLDDAAAVVARLADETLATDWRERCAAWREPVDHPAADHPGLASAYRGGAMHLLSFDERLGSARAGASLQGRVPLSVRSPRAFATLFDAESLYREVVGDDYPGPDRGPRE